MALTLRPSWVRVVYSRWRGEAFRRLLAQSWAESAGAARVDRAIANRSAGGSMFFMVGRSLLGIDTGGQVSAGRGSAGAASRFASEHWGVLEWRDNWSEPSGSRDGAAVLLRISGDVYC